MQTILLQSIHVDDFRKLIGEVIDEKLKQLTQREKPQNKTNYLDRKEVAKLLKVSLPTLNEWSKLGIIQSYRIGKRILYKQDEINSSVQQVRNLKYKRG